jgi:hypothetical protein
LHSQGRQTGDLQSITNPAVRHIDLLSNIQNMDRESDPELRLDRILRPTEEPLDPKMLRDPAE